MLDKIRAISTLFFVLAATQSCASLSNLPSSCSANWKITGYYTPVENEYQGGATTIEVDGVGSASFNARFVKDVKMEGWGKTRHDWYLGYYNQGWHKSSTPLDARGQALVVGTAATDPSHIDSGKEFYVLADATLLQNQQFVARDVGQRIRNKHVDIYTGEGQVAKRRTWDLTGQGTICLI